MCSPIRFDPEQIVRKRRDTARISQLDSIINVLFEDRAVGRITPERFEQIYSNYEKAQKYSRTCGNKIVIQFNLNAEPSEKCDGILENSVEKPFAS